MLKTVTGIFHLHTNYSFDGKSPLQEITNLAKEEGHSFLLLTEHNDDFNNEKMKKFAAECNRLSTDELVVVPGLEINCGLDRHILAIGVKKYIKTASPDEVIGQIKEIGGLVVFPHPGLYQFRTFMKSINSLNGIEVWNSRYDVRYAPNLKSFSLLKDLRKINPRIYAYGGLDLHSSSNFDALCLKIELLKLSEEEILSSLESGSFKIVRKRTVINSTGDITRSQRLFFDIAASANMLAESLWPSMKHA